MAQNVCLGDTSILWSNSCFPLSLSGKVEAATSGQTYLQQHGSSVSALQAPAVPQPPQQFSAQQFGSYIPPQLPAGSAAQAALQQSPSARLPRPVKPRPPGFGARPAPHGAFPVPPPQPAAGAPSQPAAAAEARANSGKAQTEEDSPWLASLRCPLTKVGFIGFRCFSAKCKCSGSQSQPWRSSAARLDSIRKVSAA